MAELTLCSQQDNLEISVPGDRDRFTLGRSTECDYCLSFSGISRYHACLSRATDGKWTVEDLGSKNGTRVNDLAVTAPYPLAHDDEIWLGDICLQVILATSPHAKPQTTILHDVRDLQQQWIEGNSQDDTECGKDRAIARLRDLVEIGKHLSSAESIEAIFLRVKEVVFRYIRSIDRLALLVDVDNSGTLKLLNAATRDRTQESQLTDNSDWISRTICQKVFDDKVAIQTADAQMDNRFEGNQSILFKNIRSCIAVPLWDETRVVGVLYADANFSAMNWTEAGEEDLSFFSTLANLVATNVQRWLLAQKLRCEENIRHRLERYHSPAVVQQLISVGTLADGRLPPTESEISVLFADIVGFTALSEKLRPAQIVRLLNRLFEEMLQEVFAAGGTLDKYIGDCIMAFFGAPEPQADHADRAMATAVGMLARLEKLNTQRVFGEPLQLRIAVNSGRAAIGDVGSSQRFDYTALGGTINLAARMEGICPPGECVASESTYKMLGRKEYLQRMGEYRFKGIARSIPVYQTQRHSPQKLQGNAAS